MILDFLEIVNDYPAVLLLIIIAIATMGRGIPPILERRRRRGLENAISEVLELLSDHPFLVSNPVNARKMAEFRIFSLKKFHK